MILNVSVAPLEDAGKEKEELEAKSYAANDWNSAFLAFQEEYPELYFNTIATYFFGHNLSNDDRKSAYALLLNDPHLPLKCNAFAVDGMPVQDFFPLLEDRNTISDLIEKQREKDQTLVTFASRSLRQKSDQGLTAVTVRDGKPALR